MKKILKFIGVVIAVSLIGGFFWVTREPDPAFHPHLTTWDGQLAFGQLHRNQTYSFYRAKPFGSMWEMGDHIATFPAGEAAKLH